MSQVLAAMVAASLAFGGPVDPACEDMLMVASEANRDALASAAIRAFEKENYEVAVNNFIAAYELDKRAEDLFNIGRVHEEAGNIEEARNYYQRFLQQDGISAEGKAEAQSRIDGLPAPAASASAAVAAAPQAQPSAADKELSRRDRNRKANINNDKPGKLHWATITGAALLPTGAAALIAGGVLAGTAKRNLANAQASADENTPVDQTPHYARARSQAMAADGMLIGGGIVAAAGAVFILTGLERQRRARKAAKLQVAPGVASLTLRYRF